MGEDYICLGSDYPFPLGEHVPGKMIQEMKLPPTLQQKLFQQNAVKWLNINPAY
jgi:aminocarboxymuconate-semialdehyde decarboxylase